MTSAQIDHALNAQAATARARQALWEAKLRPYDADKIPALKAAYEAAHDIELAALAALTGSVH